MEKTANSVVVPQIEQAQQQQQQQKPKKKSKNNKKSQLTTNTKIQGNGNSSNQDPITTAADIKLECKALNGLAHKLGDVHITDNNGIGTENHHMSNGSYGNVNHRNLNGHATTTTTTTTSNHNVNTTTIEITKPNNDNDPDNSSAAARKAKSKSKLKTIGNNSHNNNLKENTHCLKQEQHENNGIVENGYNFSKNDIKVEIETILEEASCSGKTCCNNNNNKSSSSTQAVERLVNMSTATTTVLTAITAKQEDSSIENNQNQNNQISEKIKSSTEEREVKEAQDIALVKDVPALDKSKVHIQYTEYQSELQMHDIMRLIQAELSEPYSIYTYRYFIYNWPKLCFLAAHENEYVGAIVCKLDMHMNVKRGYIAMLAVRKEYRNLKIGTTLVQMAIEAMLADNADEVVLETEMRNYPALHLYENLGFVRDKRLFRYYLNGVDALRLKLWFR